MYNCHFNINEQDKCFNDLSMKIPSIPTILIFMSRFNFNLISREARWPSGRASDSGRRIVSTSKIHLSPKSTGNTQEAVAQSRHD